MKKIAMILLAGIMVSCVKENDFVQPGPSNGSMQAIAENFLLAGESTKTSITQAGEDAPTFSWKEGDVIGVVPMDNETFQSNYRIKEIGSDPRQASFDGGAWSLKQGKTYAAYYPVKNEVVTSDGRLTFSFLSQSQRGNNSLEHIGNYDYMYASAVSPANDVATFAFHHLVSLLNLKIDLPEGVFNRVVLSSEESWFAENAQLSLADGAMEASTASLSTDATLVLDDINVSSGTPLSVWLSVLPTNALNDKTLTIKAYTEDYVYIGNIEVNTAFEAGKAYQYEIHPDDVCGISVAKWEYTISDSFKTATSIEFMVNQTKPESGFTDLNEDGSVWAVMEDGTLMIQTTASKISNQGHSFQGFKATRTISGLSNLDISEMYIHWLFYGCSSLTSLDLSGWDTSNVTSLQAMFGGCQALTSINLSGWDTSNVTDMDMMFYDCGSLISLDLSGWNTSNVTNMREMFCFCSSLTSLDVTGWDTSNVTNMGNMFSDCSLLTSLDLSRWDTSNVNNMRNMFTHCSSLLSIDLSKWDTSKAEDMTWMFKGCCSLTSLDLSGWDTSNVTDMYMMFCECSSLTYLDVSTWNTTKVTGMSSMFSRCEALTILDVSGWDTSNVKDMHGMFMYCSSLKYLDVSNWDTSNVSSAGALFYGCNSLANLDVSRWDTSNMTGMGCMLYGCSLLTSLDVSGWDTSKVTDMGGMFSGCSLLASLDVSGWDTSNVTNMGMMLSGCSLLTSLDVSEWGTSNVTNMREMFSGCGSLTSLDVSNWDTSKVTNMGGYFGDTGMFYDCMSLTNLDVSNWNTSNVTDMRGMFYNCSALNGLDVSKWDTSKVTDMANMFHGCSSLSSLGLSSQFKVPSSKADMFCLTGGVDGKKCIVSGVTDKTIKTDLMTGTGWDDTRMEFESTEIETEGSGDDFSYGN